MIELKRHYCVTGGKGGLFRIIKKCSQNLTAFKKVTY